MATAAWGQRVLEELPLEKGAAFAPAGPARQDVLEALHELDAGSEQRALALAAAWSRAATSPADRGTAVALAAAALVLDPTVAGYKERLIDAAGLAAYAGTLDAADPLGQAARALVGAAAGSVEQSRRLVEVVESTPQLGPEPRLFLGLSRKMLGERGGDLADHLKQALLARPGSARARAALAELWLELGVTDEALKVLDAQGAQGAHDGAWLAALRGRALLLAGRAPEAVAALRDVEGKLPEGRRGDALTWLGLALAETRAPVVDIDAIAASLGARPGFAREAAVMQAHAARQGRDLDRARAALQPLMRGPPGLPADGDAAWLLAETCAALGDTACMDGAGARAVAFDGDEARLHRVRATVAVAGVSAEDMKARLVEAHRASPFDAGLARRAGEDVVPGGAAAAARVRGARRALLRRGASFVDDILEPLAREPACRVCRALRAAAATGADAASRAVAALEGRGPPLGTSDMVLVAGALGAAPTPQARASLERLAADPRPAVRRAVERARADHADPDARRRRDAGHADDDGHAHPGGTGAHRGAPLPPAPLPGPRAGTP